jgi:peptide/nickel transport system permease protein
MFGYLIKRLAQGLLAVLMLSTLVFGLSRMSGDPVQAYLDLDATEQDELRVRRSLGLDRSILYQYGAFLSRLAQGDFGNSFRYKKPAISMFWERLPNTLILLLPAFVIGHVLSVPLGVIAATTRGTWKSSFLGGIAVFGIAVPPFWIAIMLMLVFAVKLDWLPAARMGSPEHYLLPFTTLLLGGVAGTMRLVRSSMLDQLDSEYIRLARAKGASERRVIWVHAFRNSTTALVASTGTGFALLLTGSILIENVFAWPGVGRLLQEGMSGNDFPLVQTLIVLQGLALVVINLLADIAQSLLDPRIRLTGSQ